MPLTAAEVFRDYVTAGVPASGKHSPVKRDIRILLGGFESLIPNYKMAIFSTLAEAAATEIGEDPDLVELWGRNTPGDGAFGARYIRVGSGPGTAWRFQSADGQWWALNNRSITPEMFGIFPGAENAAANTAGFQALASYLSIAAPIAVTINHTPGADYYVWSDGVAPPNLMMIAGARGLVWNWNGSRIISNLDFSLYPGQVVMAGFSHCTDIIVNDPHFVQAGTGSTLSNSTGVNMFYIIDASAPWSENFEFNNIRQQGGATCLAVTGPGDGSGGYARNIVINNGVIKDVYYGLLFQQSGDAVTVRNFGGSNIGRLYFPQNVSNHDVDLVDNGGPNDQILLKCYAYAGQADDRRQLSDIRVRYRNSQSVTAGSSCHLQAHQITAPLAVTAAANNGSGFTRLTVTSAAAVVTGQKWFFYGATGTTGVNGIHPVTKIDATHVDLLDVPYVANVPSATGKVPLAFRNISIEIDVRCNGAGGSPQLFSMSKYNASTVVDTAPAGIEISNLSLSGSIMDYAGVAPSFLRLFGADGGIWTGDTLENISIRDFKASGTGTIEIDATAVSANLLLENIKTGSGIVWTLTDPNSKVRIHNVTANGITDRVSAALLAADPAQMVTGIGADGSLLRRPFGFATGAGGTGTQSTDKSTGVTLHKATGRITTHGASLAANTGVVFTLTNATIAATDSVIVNLVSGHATPGTYHVQAEAAAAGSVKILIRNLTGGALAETLLLQFSVVKGAIT